MNKNDLKNKIQKIKLMTLLATTIGGTGLSASAQNISEGESHTDKIELSQSDAKKISTSLGNITYQITEAGVKFEGPISMIKVGSITPNLYDCDDGSIACGPLNNTIEKNLRHETDRKLKSLVIEEAIAQDIQNKSGVLSESEQNFLAAHDKEMKDWGLTTEVSGNGKIEFTQKDPMAGSGKLTFQMNSTQIAHQLNFARGR